jgi:uncharacterized membrane protein YgdD (TMEM256/DUF423 family)
LPTGSICEKGVVCQFSSTLALMAAALLMNGNNNARYLRHCRAAFSTAGILCFSGSLYLLACRDMVAVPAAVLGAVTPLGGVCLMARVGAADAVGGREAPGLHVEQRAGRADARHHSGCLV